MLNDYSVENNKDEEVEYNQSQNNNKLNKGQKMAVVLLAFFAVLVIIMWSVQFKKSISEPFVYKGNEEADISQGSSASNADSEELLKTKDTDGDGLSDWDELYLYRTSPYLEDSDSDGFFDKEEIDSGNDPNCPRGRDCYSSGLIDGEKKIKDEGGDILDNNLLLGDLLEQLNISQEQEVSQEQIQELEEIFGGQADATALRQMLLEAGMDERLLNEISDEDLLKSYQEVLGSE
jgi:hypothetical protein